MTFREAYALLSRRLRESGRPEAVECSVLFELAAGRPFYECDPEADIPQEQLDRLWDLLARRKAGEPLQYLARKWPFLDFELSVGPGVLIPRPETETLVFMAGEFLETREHSRILDLCSGSGCVAVALSRLFPEAEVAAVEKEEQAFRYLRKNVQSLRANVRAVKADVFDLPEGLTEDPWDCVVCNPPYLTDAEYEDAKEELRFEPAAAFRGGADGLDFYRALVPLSVGLLAEDGAAFFETGSSQTEAVLDLFRQYPDFAASASPDQYGLPRVVCARKSPHFRSR